MKMNCNSIAECRTAERIAGALRGSKIGPEWIAHCPAHDDRTPSLSVRETDGGQVLVYCHAGCDQGRVIATLRMLGLWAENSRFSSRPTDCTDRERYKSDTKKIEAALRIWHSTTPADGTIVETYLASRGLHVPPPPTLRFHDGLKHFSGGIWPTMVAVVTRGADDTPLGIHRTFLARDGAGKAPVDPQKMMFGPCRGGGVRLGTPGNVLMVGEGIETCLSAMQTTGLPAWAALSTSGLRALDLPDDIRDVIVLADGDDPGEAAARDAARRWKREGRRVRIARPPQGKDFNDILVDRASAIRGNAP